MARQYIFYDFPFQVDISVDFQRATIFSKLECPPNHLERPLKFDEDLKKQKNAQHFQGGDILCDYACLFDICTLIHVYLAWF